MLKPALQLKLGQQLTMTPQLQQAIRLLQLPVLELQAQIREALETNVMLEPEDEAGGPESGDVVEPQFESTTPTTTSSDSSDEAIANKPDPTSTWSTIRSGAIRRSLARRSRHGPAATINRRTSRTRAEKRCRST